MSNEFGDPATDTHLDVRRIDIRPGRQDTTILRIVWAASVFRATSRIAEDGMDGSSFRWMSARATRAMSEAPPDDSERPKVRRFDCIFDVRSTREMRESRNVGTRQADVEMSADPESPAGLCYPSSCSLSHLLAPTSCAHSPSRTRPFVFPSTTATTLSSFGFPRARPVLAACARPSPRAGDGGGRCF